MKQLLIMRHAKSSWADETLADHDRPLNSRGQNNAPRMGEFVAEQNCLPDIILSSTAQRATETAKRFVEGCGTAIPIRERRGLYHPSISDYHEAINQLSDPPERIMVVSHNPGSQEWVYQLTREYESIPTATIALLAFDDAFQWFDIHKPGTAEIVAIWRPKEVL